MDDTRDIPAWVDGTLKKAVDTDPHRRYDELSEFIFDLRHPNKNLLPSPRPLMERDPLLLWKGVAAILAIAVAVLLIVQHFRP